jgi:hypothetical protein
VMFMGPREVNSLADTVENVDVSLVGFRPRDVPLSLMTPTLWQNRSAA